eukprot:CAMPEP_0204534346 /NCGR_PEP_ID=MMETSP0661-20131031/12883_1 /ASSEMBLY_ACC=CAM_ASM_000606 /TAXON_ID=109239 /ORGANISM="Alexandrium margalefi, Strain AMGDE01CS-322" /LENGTH=160 /DNA_ID=CAMNT_0051540799 /DNA_START=30 /DNA_END=508 /DNA_ORIENTATION=-
MRAESTSGSLPISPPMGQRDQVLRIASDVAGTSWRSQGSQDHCADGADLVPGPRAWTLEDTCLQVSILTTRTARVEEKVHELNETLVALVFKATCPQRGMPGDLACGQDSCSLLGFPAPDLSQQAMPESPVAGAEGPDAEASFEWATDGAEGAWAQAEAV